MRPGFRVLIVRGADASGQPAGRGWLARELEAAGAACDTVASYRRLAPSLSGDDLRLAAEGAAGSAVWLFSSSEAIVNLRHGLPAGDWSSARAIATHERIADAARAAGFGVVRLSHPSMAGVVASIESFR